MTRNRRTRILVHATSSFRERLCNVITQNHPAADIEPAAEGLVMMKMRDAARHTLFYLGEVLVTEAKVQVAGSVGVGIISGNQPDAARELAIIDAAYNAGLPETAGWEEALIAEEARQQSERKAGEARLLDTRVSFDVMDNG